MVRLLRLSVLAVITFYAVAGGVIPSPLAAAGANCVMASGNSADDGPMGCDGGCPATLCASVPYATPDLARVAVPYRVNYITYAAALPDQLVPHAPDPAYRPPSF